VIRWKFRIAHSRFRYFIKKVLDTIAQNKPQRRLLMIARQSNETRSLQPHYDQMIVQTHYPGSFSSQSERWSLADSESASRGMLADQSVLKKRDLEFPRHDVTVVRRKECRGLSSFYEAKDKSVSLKNGGTEHRDRPRNYLMKATGMCCVCLFVSF
jgi:hypothetical protein